MTSYFKLIEWMAWTDNQAEHNMATCLLSFDLFFNVYGQVGGQAGFVKLATRILRTL